MAIYNDDSTGPNGEPLFDPQPIHLRVQPGSQSSSSPGGTQLAYITSRDGRMWRFVTDSTIEQVMVDAGQVPVTAEEAQ